MDYEKFFDEVFNLDKKIRYVGIFQNGRTYTKSRPDIQNLLSPEETKKSLKDTGSRWKTRESLSPKLGKPLYAMAAYEKIKRITVPIKDSGLILVSTELDAYHEIITKEILEIIDRRF